MDKYRKVDKPKSTEAVAEDEIRVTSAGSVSAYISRAAKVFNELEKPKVVIKATGGALTKAVTLTEVIKRRFKGLHQITSLGSVEIVDEYEPLEEGLEMVTDTRTVAVLDITLSKEALDSSDKGYQPPIDEALVTDFDPEQVGKGRGRGKGRGKGKGKGEKGKGKSKGEGKSAPKGKGKDKDKGKGKAAEPSSKGKGKGKGKAAPTTTATLEFRLNPKKGEIYRESYGQLGRLNEKVWTYVRKGPLRLESYAESPGTRRYGSAKAAKVQTLLDQALAMK